MEGPDAAGIRIRGGLGAKPPLVVRAIPTDPSVRSSESLFLTETEHQGTATRRLLEVATITAPHHFAGVMGDSTVIVRRRLMSVDGIPVRIANSYFPAESPESEQLRRSGFIEGGLQKLFEDHGRRFGKARETLTARVATPEEALTLQLAQGEPVVQIIRTSFDDRGDAVHTLETICSASRHVFVVTPMDGDSAF